MITPEKYLTDLGYDIHDLSVWTNEAPELMRQYAEYCLKMVRLVVVNNIEERDSFETSLYEHKGRTIRTNVGEILKELKFKSK